MTWTIPLLSGRCKKEPKDASDVETGPPKAEVKSRPKTVSPVKELLRYFEAPGVPPPSSRVGDPNLKQRVSEPFKLTDLWRYGAFAAWKGERPTLGVDPAAAEGLSLQRPVRR